MKHEITRKQFTVPYCPFAVSCFLYLLWIENFHPSYFKLVNKINPLVVITIECIPKRLVQTFLSLICNSLLMRFRIEDSSRLAKILPITAFGPSGPQVAPLAKYALVTCPIP